MCQDDLLPGAELGPDVKLPALPGVEFVVFSKRHDVESAIADLMNEIVRAAFRRRTRNRNT
jgi:hypothetical protein